MSHKLEPGSARSIAPRFQRVEYKEMLHALQVELVKLQRHLIERGERMLVIVEGRDAAGKDGLIKRITAHMSPRETRVFAVGVPTERERTSWYFQRFVPHLPAGGEFVIFNRSWYNRAGVERVMKFCTDGEYEQFMLGVPTFETMLVQSGITVFKYYLDISCDEQKKRLEARENDPLKQWKTSPIDKVAHKHWKDYSRARDVMFRRTSHPAAPWFIVCSDHKKTARVAVLSDLLSRTVYPHKKPNLSAPDRRMVFAYSDEPEIRDRIAP